MGITVRDRELVSLFLSQVLFLLLPASASHAMLILSCSSKLRLLEEMLKKSLPQTLQVYGAVMNINRGNPVGHEVIVDSWPDFKAVLTRPRREAVSDNADFLSNLYAAFYRDLDVYRKLLLDTDAINWDQTFALCGNSDGIHEVSKEAVADKRIQLTATPYFTYLNLNPDKLSLPRLDPGFTFSSLNSSHIDLLNETWHFGGSEHSRRYLANMVRNFPSTCILDSNGHPISWLMMESLCTLRHGYTLPSHRRKGYASMVLRAQATRVHAAGFPVFGLVALDNTPSQKLLVSLGFQRLSELCHYCIHSPASQKAANTKSLLKELLTEQFGSTPKALKRICTNQQEDLEVYRCLQPPLFLLVPASSSASQAMLILSCPSKLQYLERLLKKSLPQTLQVYGAVMNINRGNPVGHEVIVDSWPDFKAVLTRPQKEAVSDKTDSFNNIYAAFYQDLDAYRRLFLDSDAIRWDQAFTLCGNGDGIYEVSKEAVAIKKVQMAATPYFIYLNLNPDKLSQPRLEPGFTFSSLNSSHIDLLNETWPYGGSEHSRRYLANMVRNFPSTCILDSNGHPISWIIMEALGSNGHSYTLPSHRRKGYSSTLLRAHILRIHAAGFPVYGFTAPDNIPQQKLLASLGFQRLSELCHYCIYSPASQ